MMFHRPLTCLQNHAYVPNSSLTYSPAWDSRHLCPAHCWWYVPPPGDVFPPPPPGAYSLRLLTICIDCRSRLCAKFIAHLFPRPELPPSSSRSTVKLTYFIMYALHRTKLPPSVCGPHPPSTTQGAFSHRTGIIGPSSLRIRIHVGQQGHL